MITQFNIIPKNPPIHVYPVDDLMEHKIEDINDKCSCNPEIKIENETIIVVHNAKDKRL